MPNRITIPQNLADLLANPKRVADALALLNGLAEVQIMLEQPAAGNSLNRGKVGIVGSPDNLQIRLPLQFAAPIPDAIGNTTSVKDTINAVLAQLRLTGILPGSG